MVSRGSFERRLLLALLLFSLLPSLALLGAGAYAVSEAVSLGGVVGEWDRVARSGQLLIEHAEASGDPALIRAAAEHRSVLSGSVVQARRWSYLLNRVLGLIPAAALMLAAVLVWTAVRFSREMAHQLSRPVRDLVAWAGRVARGEPLPPPGPAEAGGGELGVLQSAFRSMSVELERSRARALEDERTRTWVSMARRIAHELKNPLTPMRFAVRTLERTTADQPAAREALDVLETESARLDDLARSFAQFGRLPEGAPSEVDLRELLEYLLRTHIPPHVEHHLHAPEDLPLLRGYHDALARAFTNLLLNAADAVGEGGVIRVSIRHEEGAVEVRIADSGPGIPDEHRERIWEPDFTTKSRGTGLGLALVRQAVLAHGGEVRAGNRTEGGAEFGVRLPLSGETLPAPAA